MKARLPVLLIVLLGLITLATAADMVIIAHKDVVDENLTQDDLQDIYLGKKTKWSDNSEIKPVELKKDDLHENFLKEMVNRSKRLYQNHWNKMVFTGQGFPPKNFKTQAELIEYVAKTPGAVGYVTAGQQTKDVKILTIK